MTLAASLLHALPSAHRPLTGLIERLSTTTAAFSLDETSATARPYLLASLSAALGRPLFVIVPTADVAERTYADLLYYREDCVALLRPRGEALGAIESPSERSARMTVLDEMASGRHREAIVIAPVAALRQYVMPKALFGSLTFTLEVGAETGWNDLLNTLHRLGYTRVDVVSAVGEYAVRGGILDLYAATAIQPARIEFFGDEVESIRPFDLTSQRSESTLKLASLRVTPWTEIPRDAIYRERLLARVSELVDPERASPQSVAEALRQYLDAGAELPEAWLSIVHEHPETLLDYAGAHSVIVLDEPAMLAAVERSLEEERERETRSFLREIDVSQLAPTGDEIGEALLAEVTAPYPRLAESALQLAAHPLLILPGAIEGEALPWLPRIAEHFVLETGPAEHFNRQIGRFIEAIRAWSKAGDTVLLVVTGPSRVVDLLREADLPVEREAERLHLQKLASVGGRPIYVDTGSIDAGFTIPAARLHVLGDREIFGQSPKRVKLRAVKEGVPVTLGDLRVGDFVVHAVHGIGQYLGLRTEKILGATSDYLDLRFAGTDRMLVPVHQMHQVTKYGATEGANPRLSKMGGADWARTKSRVSEALAKIAEGLVQLYAERELAPGHAYPPDTPWQGELEEGFPYETTPDQQKAIDETKRDMERQRPMDRLVCGDVGYGKTEVAIRAAFKAVCDRRQVAVLVPTTLLAAQHTRTFNDRFASFPVRIEELSRFKTKKEQEQTLRALADGKVDIVVGTHRLLQRDVHFADLGLIIVDEEQRFGVMHKERLKQMRASVDVLTLSATPIPRTLHLSLMGVRDLSLIQTAPRNRLSVKTTVLPASEAVVRKAIVNELDREGQVYYLHNRVESIEAVRRALEGLVPKARIAVGHGAMTEAELEPVMTRFIEGEIDVLVATTIIENGIDIPNVNTIIVNDADRFGLSQLYQLRGRVGRSNHQAYAYLLYQGHKVLSEEAKARLAAIREFTHLGSGLQIAMRDLEIRGAGNLLGAAQSGFIGAVGFETYCQLLAEAVAQRRGTATGAESAREAVIDVKLDAYVPNDFIPQVSQKIAVYQQLASARTEAEVDEIAAGVRDRFGPLPEPLEQLIAITHLRTIALAKRVTRVIIDEQRLTFGVGSAFAIDPAAIAKLRALTKDRFRIAEGKIVVDLPKPPLHTPPQRSIIAAMPLVRQLLEAL